MYTFTTKIYVGPNFAFVYIPSDLRNERELIEGDVLSCILKKVFDHSGEVLSEPCLPFKGIIACYWNELHIPPEVVTKGKLQPGLVLELQIS